jgi:hypothetical protein
MTPAYFGYKPGGKFHINGIGTILFSQEVFPDSVLEPFGENPTDIYVLFSLARLVK